MKMETVYIVRSFFSVFLSFELTTVDTILFLIDVHSFVRENEYSVLEQNMLKRLVKRLNVFRNIYRQSFSSRTFA